MGSKIVELGRRISFAIQRIKYEVAVLVNEACYCINELEPRLLIELWVNQ